MKKLNSLMIFSVLFVAAACVTINVYFPAAAAEKAAEQFVGDVLGQPLEDSSIHGPPGSPAESASRVLWLAATGLADLLIPSAQAQQAEIEINTPQINAIKARMAQRQRQTLDAWFDAGAVGFTRDGLVSVRDRSAVALSERRRLDSVVAEENRDRKAVYREIAIANGHPEWEADIQQTFASQWVRNARKGWFYQDASGAWRQK
jgi:uncharacterized protein YdbL (DUF1318 family)